MAVLWGLRPQVPVNLRPQCPVDNWSKSQGFSTGSFVQSIIFSQLIAMSRFVIGGGLCRKVSPPLSASIRAAGY